MRALGGVHGGAMYGFGRDRESFSRSIWRRAFSDDALDILPGMAGSGVRGLIAACEGHWKCSESPCAVCETRQYERALFTGYLVKICA